MLISHILSENLKSSGWSSFQIAIHICLDSAILCDSQTCGISNKVEIIKIVKS
ncbi:hypothetical protein D1BOALGB6SA_6481 [Olavius sp. associated proteobacterium Delta 1]|nr:hypothetical protein D1BOALGB6SA_6481 [Olavius sp. associated proteobacterium Delta 1]